MNNKIVFSYVNIHISNACLKGKVIELLTNSVSLYYKKKFGETEIWR